MRRSVSTPVHTPHGAALEQLTVTKEVRPQHLRDGEDPLRMSHGLENFLAQTRRRCRTPLRAARWAQPPTLTRERHQDISSTAAAMEPREPVLEDPAVQIPSQPPRPPSRARSRSDPRIDPPTLPSPGRSGSREDGKAVSPRAAGTDRRRTPRGVIARTRAAKRSGTQALLEQTPGVKACSSSSAEVSTLVYTLAPCSAQAMSPQPVGR
jgi:hypothetical protein